ncbi:hypothetical protein HWV62_35320 [Athelia sp. TMB]|nr:hypothetical protein HWV62_35320 [Athelia sp. TMB]
MSRRPPNFKYSWDSDCLDMRRGLRDDFTLQEAPLEKSICRFYSGFWADSLVEAVSGVLYRVGDTVTFQGDSDEISANVGVIVGIYGIIADPDACQTSAGERKRVKIHRFVRASGKRNGIPAEWHEITYPWKGDVVVRPSDITGACTVFDKYIDDLSDNEFFCRFSYDTENYIARYFDWFEHRRHANDLTSDYSSSWYWNLETDQGHTEKRGSMPTSEPARKKLKGDSGRAVDTTGDQQRRDAGEPSHSPGNFLGKMVTPIYRPDSNKRKSSETSSRQAATSRTILPTFGTAQKGSPSLVSAAPKAVQASHHDSSASRRPVTQQASVSSSTSTRGPVQGPHFPPASVSSGWESYSGFQAYPTQMPWQGFSAQDPLGSYMMPMQQWPGLTDPPQPPYLTSIGWPQSTFNPGPSRQNVTTDPRRDPRRSIASTPRVAPAAVKAVCASSSVPSSTKLTPSGTSKTPSASSPTAPQAASAHKAVSRGSVAQTPLGSATAVIKPPRQAAPSVGPPANLTLALQKQNSAAAANSPRRDTPTQAASRVSTTASSPALTPPATPKIAVAPPPSNPKLQASPAHVILSPPIVLKPPTQESVKSVDELSKFSEANPPVTPAPPTETRKSVRSPAQVPSIFARLPPTPPRDVAKSSSSQIETCSVTPPTPVSRSSSKKAAQISTKPPSPTHAVLERAASKPAPSTPEPVVTTIPASPPDPAHLASPLPPSQTEIRASDVSAAMCLPQAMADLADARDTTTTAVVTPVKVQSPSPSDDMLVDRDYDPDFADSEATVVLTSSDGVNYRLHPFTLRITAPYFRGKSATSFTLTEPSKVLGKLLRIISGLGTPTWDSIEDVCDSLAAAHKYGMVGPLGTIRGLILPGFNSKRPLEVYAIAAQYEWEEEAKVASMHTLALDIHDPVHAPALQSLPSSYLLRLFQLHRTRRDKFMQHVSGGGDRPLFGITACPLNCGEEHKRNDALAVLMHEMVREMERRPDGHGLLSGAWKDWPAYRNGALCPPRKMHGPGYGDSIMQDVKVALDGLPLTI